MVSRPACLDGLSQHECVLQIVLVLSPPNTHTHTRCLSMLMAGLLSPGFVHWLCGFEAVPWLQLSPATSIVQRSEGIPSPQSEPRSLGSTINSFTFRLMPAVVTLLISDAFLAFWTILFHQSEASPCLPAVPDEIGWAPMRVS